VQPEANVSEGREGMTREPTLRDIVGQAVWDDIHSEVWQALPRFEWVRVDELKDRLGLGRETLRKHMLVLERQGRAQRREADNGRGHVWRRRM
jgi:hypothetical protein